MKIIECPRDAMQGLHEFIPTDAKAAYINQLLKVGFDTIDFGSFVSPKAIPQMRDTAEVLNLLHDKGSTSLLSIVANARGAEDAVKYDQIDYLGFPLSISETFQQRNTNKSIQKAFDILDEIHSLCKNTGKQLVVYISMCFGNPYNDPYNVDVVQEFVEKLIANEIKIISLSDTIGVSQPAQITYLFDTLTKSYSKIEFGAHLHSDPFTAIEKISAAYKAGCRRFDGAIKGLGGCPMAKDELVGNMATETIVNYLEDQNALPRIDKNEFMKSVQMASEVFPS